MIFSRVCTYYTKDGFFRNLVPVLYIFRLIDVSGLQNFDKRIINFNFREVIKFLYSFLDFRSESERKLFSLSSMMLKKSEQLKI